MPSPGPVWMPLKQYRVQSAYAVSHAWMMMVVVVVVTMIMKLFQFTEIVDRW